jgi:hypothetical protein
MSAQSKASILSWTESVVAVASWSFLVSILYCNGRQGTAPTKCEQNDERIRERSFEKLHVVGVVEWIVKTDTRASMTDQKSEATMD